MKLDIELIRKLLNYIENQNEWFQTQNFHMHDYDDKTIGYHFKLLFDDKYIDANDISDKLRQNIYNVKGLTMKGHEFLKLIRDDTIWKKIMHYINTIGGVISLESFKIIIEKYLNN